MILEPGGEDLEGREGTVVEEEKEKEGEKEVRPKGREREEQEVRLPAWKYPHDPVLSHPWP